MRKVSVLVARFPFGASEHPDTSDWMISTIGKMKADERIGEVLATRVDDTPITMSRNRVLKQALDSKSDFCLMLDSDMAPDLAIPGAKPFWDTSFDFALNHEGPCVVAAPYCGPPPNENVYVFRWARVQGDHPNPDLRLEQYPREEAAGRIGFEEVGALPTGLILIDMRAIPLLPPPWFEYEWKDPPFNTEKGSTEDVFFTRNLSNVGVPQYVAWDSWAGHWKSKCVSKPQVMTCESVRAQLREAVLSGRRDAVRLTNVNEGRKTRKHR